MAKFTLHVDFDQDVESPETYDGQWRLYSFRRGSGVDPYEYLSSKTRGGEVVAANIGFQRKLDCGTAFIVSCYQHSNVVWSLRGEGPQCQWDTAQIAGVLVWEHSVSDMGAKDKAGRAEDARGFLREFNAWSNGQCFCYWIEDEHGENTDSCGGFIGAERFAKMIHEDHPELFADGVELEIVGEAAGVMED